jgi:hypothetical protein
MRNHETMCAENIEGEVKKRKPKYREQTITGSINIDSLVDAHIEPNFRKCIFH